VFVFLDTSLSHFFLIFSSLISVRFRFPFSSFSLFILSPLFSTLPLSISCISCPWRNMQFCTMCNELMLIFTVVHNYGNHCEKWNIFVAGPHLWLQLGMVKPEIILCETVQNLSTLNTLTYLLTNILTSHVSRSLMVSVGVSVLGTTSIHFIEPGVRINSQYYREDLLMQKLLPDIRQLSDFYVFQQDSAPAHRARKTIELLTMETQSSFLPRFGHQTARI